jgi:hypothetical protein
MFELIIAAVLWVLALVVFMLVAEVVCGLLFKLADRIQGITVEQGGNKPKYSREDTQFIASKVLKRM